jgi:spore maturation protein CgeB
MYSQLQRSKIALNIHIDMAEQYAANMRLYEATGVGTMLLTDWKTNLHELFELGKEVVAYRSTGECVEMVKYYLAHDAEREAIARAGQQRTLSEHSYYHRMQELTEILSRYLNHKAHGLHG